VTDLLVSQGGAEALVRVQSGMQVSQAGVELLGRVQPNFSVTQAGVEVLVKARPCSTRDAQVWTITRLDGTVYRFTSLDRDLEWGGATYAACNSLDPSASENVAEVDSAGSMDLSGALSADGIDGWDLYAGLFDGAEVEAWLVPWDVASRDGLPRRLLRGNFGSVELGETGFKVELIGDGAKLQQTPLVRALQPGCRWQFGDEGCGKDLGPLTVTGTVDSAIGQRAFTDAARTEAAGYFRRGRVTFTGGSNAGLSAEIKEHDAGGTFVLWPRLPFAISAGDTYSIVPGCTNLKTAEGGTNGCTAWAQLLRYGGFDKVPGGDKRGKAAIQKAPD
jgi:uncharacterized phage protein (TIGR02218 family)